MVHKVFTFDSKLRGDEYEQPLSTNGQTEAVHAAQFDLPVEYPVLECLKDGWIDSGSGADTATPHPPTPHSAAWMGQLQLCVTWMDRAS